MEHRVVTDYTNVHNNELVKVYVRLRPLGTSAETSEAAAGSEESQPQDMFSLREQRQLSLKNNGNTNYGEHKFLFDKVFWTDTRQAMLFQEVARPLVDSCLEGRNCCAFAYGQTGERH